MPLRASLGSASSSSHPLPRPGAQLRRRQAPTRCPPRLFGRRPRGTCPPSGPLTFLARPGTAQQPLVVLVIPPAAALRLLLLVAAALHVKEVMHHPPQHDANSS